MTILEAIDTRQSRRGYLGTPIDKESIHTLTELMNKFNNISGLSIQFIENGSKAFEGFSLGYGMFRGVRSYFALVGKTSDPHSKEKCGYYGELLVLEATRLGLGTCWVGGTFRRGHCPAVVNEDEVLVSLITVGNVVEKKSLREKTIYKLSHRGTKSVEQLYKSNADVPDWFLVGMKAVVMAPSAINLQPVLFTYSKEAVTAEVKNMTNLLPVDLGIAKAHFELAAGGKFEFGNKAPFIKD
jgi:nitroreductase